MTESTVVAIVVGSKRDASIEIYLPLFHDKLL